MASTNKTTNLLLSQFLGTDHFSFLTDYNGDMLKVDTYCGNLKSLIDGQGSTIESSTESIQEIQSDIQSIQKVQQNQNTAITDNTEDISELKSTTTFIGAKVDRNTADIKALQDSVGENLSLALTENNKVPSGLNFTVTYNSQSQSLSFLSPLYERVGATNISNVNMTGTIDISRLPEKVQEKLGTGLNRTITGGWINYGFYETIDGETILRSASVPITLQLYNNGSGLSYRIQNANYMPTWQEELSRVPIQYLIDATFMI